MSKNLLLSTAFAALTVACLPAQLTAKTTLSPIDGSGSVTLAMTGAPGNIGFLCFATEASGPVPTPYGPLFLMPPTVLEMFVFPASGFASFTYPLSPMMGSIAAAFQGAIVRPDATAVLTNYVLVGYSYESLLAGPGEGAGGNYQGATGDYDAVFAGHPGARIEVVRRNGPHVIVMTAGQIGPNGFGRLNGNIFPKLTPGEHPELRINGRTITTLK
jgi:hypothetical protein